MRILALMTEAFGGRGGIARYNQALVHALVQSPQVAQVVVLPRTGHVETAALPHKAVQLAPATSRISYSARAAWAALTGETFDVVLCGHLNMCALARGLASLARARLWLQVHGIDAWQCPQRHLRAAAESADLVTAVSRYTRNRLLSWADIDPSRARVLPNTYQSRFSPGPKPQSLIQRLGLDGRKVILTVSRLAASERYKGHDRVIGALSEVLRRHPTAVYVVVGDGDDLDRLEALARTLGVAHAVAFAGGVPDDQLPDHYRLADAFVMPSTGEGFGIVYLEAVASAVPVVAGNCDGSADALADGALGTLIAPADGNGLAAAIIDALDRDPRQATPSADRFAFANFATHVDRLVRSSMIAGSNARHVSPAVRTAAPAA